MLEWAKNEDRDRVAYYLTINAAKDYEHKKRLTYRIDYVSYASGAHGIEGNWYTTFRKSDGKRSTL